MTVDTPQQNTTLDIVKMKYITIIVIIIIIILFISIDQS